MENKFMVNPVNKTTESSETGYSVGGKIVGVDNAKCLAKTIMSEHGRIFYYVLRSTKTGGLFNYLDDDFDDIKTLATDIGKNKFEFTKVHEDAFKSYKRFLETSNEVHLRNAQRTF